MVDKFLMTLTFSGLVKDPCIFTKDFPNAPFFLLSLRKFLEPTDVLGGLALCAKVDQDPFPTGGTQRSFLETSSC
jgi:hypothetical protein